MKINAYYFTASWCAPCQAFKPTFKKVAGELEGENFTSRIIDINTNGELCSEFELKSVPTIVLVDSKGVTLDKKVGTQSEESLRKWLDSNLKK